MTTTALRGTPGRLPRHVRVMLRLNRKGLPPPQCAVTVEQGIEVPAPGGVTLRTDHYIPQLSGPGPTLLVRSPYGRGFPWDHMFGALFGQQGFHVVIQSCRGTGGSGGTYEPFRHEQADGQAAVAWLREQDWFNGALGTIGPSYLSYVQGALATDPPPELRAMVLQNVVLDPRALTYPGGAFALENILVAAAATVGFERGMAGLVKVMLRLQRHLRRAAMTLPLIDAYPAALGGRLDFIEEWLTHPDAADPYWDALDLAGGARPAVPVTLLTGWDDICLDQTLDIYGQQRASGAPVRLVVGPWTHSSAFSKDMPIVFGEALSWLRAQLSGDPGHPANPPVRVHVGGGGEWRDLPDWPPPQRISQPWYLTADGGLGPEPPAVAGVSSFRYDPADPTPSVGGQLLTSKAGAVDNQALEARADVLVFTGPPLTEALDVIGPVRAELRVRTSGPHFDIFARLCDVDPRGRSRNVCDGLLRHRSAVTGVTGESPSEVTGETPSEVTGESPSDLTAENRPGPGGETPVAVAMSSTAYRFGAGHRLRLQISGGAHPRFARNTGTGEPLATATRLVPVDVTIVLDTDQPATLSLPVMAAPSP
jgi:putative CocE/NonD family hydrolase